MASRFVGHQCISVTHVQWRHSVFDDVTSEWHCWLTSQEQFGLGQERRKDAPNRRHFVSQGNQELFTANHWKLLSFALFCFIWATISPQRANQCAKSVNSSFVQPARQSPLVGSHTTHSGVSKWRHYSATATWLGCRVSLLFLIEANSCFYCAKIVSWEIKHDIWVIHLYWLFVEQ